MRRNMEMMTTMNDDIQLQYAGDMLKSLADNRVRKCLSTEELDYYYKKIANYLLSLVSEKA